MSKSIFGRNRRSNRRRVFTRNLRVEHLEGRDMFAGCNNPDVNGDGLNSALDVLEWVISYNDLGARNVDVFERPSDPAFDYDRDSAIRPLDVARLITDANTNDLWGPVDYDWCDSEPQSLFAIDSDASPFGVVVANQRDVVFKESILSGEGDVFVTSMSFTLTGSQLSAHNWALWAFQGDGVPDLLLQDSVASSNLVVFDDIIGGGYPILDDSIGFFRLVADASSTGEGTLQIALDGLSAESLEDGSPIETEVLSSGEPTLWEFHSHGNFHVGDLELQGQHLLGGTTFEALGLQFSVAEIEPIQIRELDFMIFGDRGSIDRVELRLPGDAQPFALATAAACENGGGSFCLPSPFSLPTGTTNVFVEVRTKTDTEGGRSGDKFEIVLLPGGIKAVGERSINQLLGSAPALPIVSASHTVVMSEIGYVYKADPNADGTAIPTGSTTLAQFGVFAAPHENFRNGSNDVVIDQLSVVVHTENVMFDADRFTIANKADVTTTSTSYVLTRLDNTLIQEAAFTGSFRITFTGLSSSVVMTAIDQNERVTFVLGAFVLNEHVNSAEFSHAQAFADLTKLNWIDEDFGESVPVSGTDFSSTLVPGTRYES